MSKEISNFEFDNGTYAETVNLINHLGGVRLPVFPETYAVEGFDDEGRATITLYRKSGKSSFFAREYLA